MTFKNLDTANNNAVISLYLNTFTDSEGKNEGKIIAELVQNLIVQTPFFDLRGYFLEKDNKLIAGALFSRFSAEERNINAFIMAPVAVHSHYQKQGYGQKLIKMAHNALCKEGIELCLSYGDINFYRKVGYEVISEEIIQAPLKLSYPEGWIAHSLIGKPIPKLQGQTFCVQALNHQKYW